MEREGGREIGRREGRGRGERGRRREREGGRREREKGRDEMLPY